MVNKIDNLDLKIIHCLQNDGRIPITELAKKTGTSRQTIAIRLKRLMDEKLIVVKGGLNIGKFDFKMACVGLEVKNENTRRGMEQHLKDCPRVAAFFRTPEKANMHLEVWGENDQTLASTIESFRDLENIDIIYTHYLGTPIHGDIILNVAPLQSNELPCGKNCIDCYRYANGLCVGCPISSDYKNPLLE
jgi:DNA-binding Lrp family transcriptional regulator